MKTKMYNSYHKSRSYQKFKRIFGPLLCKKPDIIYRDQTKIANTPYIFLSNHGLNGSSALFANEIYLPYDNAPIGQQEVFKGFKARYDYLYTFNHRLRRGVGRFSSFLTALYETIFTKKLYQLCKCIPSYRDHRFVITLKMATECLEEGISLLIYPENLKMGYNNIFIEYLPGFVFLAKNHLKRTNKDIPVCAIYYSKQTNQLLIDEPFSVNEMLKEGLTKEEIASFFANRTNRLYIDYVEPKMDEAERLYKEKHQT